VAPPFSTRSFKKLACSPGKLKRAWNRAIGLALRAGHGIDCADDGKLGCGSMTSVCSQHSASGSTVGMERAQGAVMACSWC
jgi:hypothetical protein